MSWLTEEEKGRDRHPGLDFTNAKDMTKQEFRKECDINHIIGTMEAQGIIANFNRFGPDWTEGSIDAPESFHEAMIQVVEAQEMFMQIPSKVRARFANDPAQFLDFISNPENRDQAEDLGLVPARRKEGPAEPTSAEAEAEAPAPKPGQGSE